VGDPVLIPERFNAAAFFVDRHIEQRRGDRPAVRFEGRSLTYADIHQNVNRVGNALLDCGVENGDRVLMVLLDGPEFVETFFGAIKIGAVPVPVNTLMRSSDYRFFLEDSRAKIAVVARGLMTEVGPALASAKHLELVVVLGSAIPGMMTSSPHTSFHGWIADAPVSLKAADTSKDDAAFWLYSSGSTGFPKGAVHRQRDMLVCSDTYALQILGITERDITFSAAKLFFAYGLGNNLYFPTRIGKYRVFPRP